MSQKNAKATPASKPVETKAKGIRSDRIQRTRRRGDPKLLAHTYAAGAVDKGAKDSPFVAVTRSKRTGLIMETRHKTYNKALDAMWGRETHHDTIAIRDESEIIARRIAEEAQAQAKADKEAKARQKAALEAAEKEAEENQLFEPLTEDA